MFQITLFVLNTGLRINTIDETAKILFKCFRSRLTNHQNPLMFTSNTDAIPGNPLRRVKRRWCRDLNQN